MTAAPGDRPTNCRNRLRDEGKPYPKSGCHSCGDGGLRGCPHERQRDPMKPGPLAGAFTAPAMLSGPLSAFSASTLSIGGAVSIDLRDGKVTYAEGATQDQASRRFWEAVGRLVRP